MRIVCPVCTAAYEVPEAKLAPGRAVRCARCGTDWLPLAAEAPVSPVPSETPPDMPKLASTSDPATAPAPVPTLAARARRVDAAVMAGWAASLALLAALGWSSVRWRTDVMHAWPPSERLYAALGLASGSAGQ